MAYIQIIYAHNRFDVIVSLSPMNATTNCYVNCKACFLLFLMQI